MKLYDKENLKNSRIFFDKRPPKFMIFLVYFTLIILILLVFASSKIKKNYIVKANGQISDRNIIYASSNVNGTIKEIKAKEGSFVKEGDVILVVSNGEENTQRKEYEKILEDNKSKKDLLVKYRKSLDEKINYLSDTGLEQEYYGKVEYYLDVINSENQNKTFTNEDISKKQDKLNEKIDEKDRLKSSLDELEENKNYYKNLVKYYENINFIISDMQEEILILQESEKANKELINQKRAKLKELQIEIREMSSAQESSSKAESEYEQVKSKIESLDTEIEGLREELIQLDRQLNSLSSQSNQIYFQFINEIGLQEKEIEKYNSEINMNISMLSKRDQNYEIIAPSKGYIHYINSLKEGVNVQVNQTLVEISELKDDNYFVEAYINVQDISKVKEEQEVDVAVVGVNTYKYGTLKGKIFRIENGHFTAQTQEGNSNFYKAQIEIKDKKLAKGNQEIPLLLSMPVEVRIIYDKETYLDYFLEKLSFKE